LSVFNCTIKINVLLQFSYNFLIFQIIRKTINNFRLSLKMSLCYGLKLQPSWFDLRQLKITLRPACALCRHSAVPVRRISHTPVRREGGPVRKNLLWAGGTVRQMSAAAALPEIREIERVADISTIRDTKERGMRPGQKFVNFTSNIAILVGFGRACAPVRCARPSNWAY
jgi:hypothetical protein